MTVTLFASVCGVTRTRTGVFSDVNVRLAADTARTAPEKVASVPPTPTKGAVPDGMGAGCPDGVRTTVAPPRMRYAA